MNQKSLDIMKRLLTPTSRERMEELARRRSGPSGYEQLTLADAGLEDEVRLLIASRETGPAALD